MNECVNCGCQESTHPIPECKKFVSKNLEGKMSEWPCEHILQEVKNLRQFYWDLKTANELGFTSFREYKVADSVNVCCLCSAKRPEPPKLLWEKLRDWYDSPIKEGGGPQKTKEIYYTCLAKEAVKAVEEIVEEYKNQFGELRTQEHAALKGLKTQLQKELLGQ